MSWAEQNAFNEVNPRRGGPCGKCGVERRFLHRDHIMPRFRGGTDDPSNIQYLCANCHEDKTAEDMPYPGSRRGSAFRAKVAKFALEQFEVGDFN